MEYKKVISLLNDCVDYDDSELLYAINLAVGSLEKEVPMDPVGVGFEMAECPRCNQDFEIKDKINYCFNCGQNLGWSNYYEG